MAPRPHPERWIVLGLNGAFLSLSRAAPPPSEAIIQAAMALDQQQLVGWLVKLHGDFYRQRDDVQLAMIKLLSSKDGLYDMAVDAFHKRRKEMFKTLKANAAKPTAGPEASP